MSVETSTDEVTVTFPATAGYLALCRLNVATLAGMNEFDVEALDDLRLAVTEAISWLLDGEDGTGTVAMHVRARPARIEFAAERRPPGPAAAAMDDLASAILGATVDDVWTVADSDRRAVSFVKSTPA